MKMLSVLLLVTASLQTSFAKADECGFVCDKLGSIEARIECVGILRSGYTQAGACRVCDMISTSNGTNACLQQIIGKTYTQSELNTCAAIPGIEPTVQCMRAAGGYSHPDHYCNLRQLHSRVRGAITNFESGNYDSGINTLHNMDRQLDRCLNPPPVIILPPAPPSPPVNPPAPPRPPVVTPPSPPRPPVVTPVPPRPPRGRTPVTPAPPSPPRS